MNSYPSELLTQLAPVMFVAGLDVPNPPSDAPSTSQSPRPQDSFHQLVQRLRDALIAQRKPAIWQPDKSKTFQAVLVDKDVRFPPRKVLPPEDPGYSSAHSPLSPLTQSSPLYPDGLIAPIWVRKHTTLVPSVFVLFKRLYEPAPHTPRSPLDLPDPERDRDRESEERRHDSELAAEVALRKRSTNERGMKLTVVLLASRKILDDPSLDTRLTFIRRQSGLDSRAALFVLSPVSQAELAEFIQSLQQALYDPALEYYTSHSKRVRRKRNRHSQAVSSYPNPIPPLGNGNASRPLRPEGWTVRYEYKMACFAEFRGEDEVALKHYQDAYEALVIMFGSIIILPPRTKRWAEAKVLADCINIKVHRSMLQITKLYLYNNENSLALSHHTTHMRRFGDFSRGWGIGEDTYEYWSWMARQHRVLAELIEQGTHAGLVIPIHKPIVSPSSLNSATTGTFPRVSSPGLEMDAIRSLGINPNHALQHPGFYYYMAAQCTESRKERFNAAVETERGETTVSSSPGFANEKKVDHFVLILELYTKSYEIFKKYAEATSQTQQGRLPLYIAYRIAQTYQDSGKIDMAIRFFERIAKTYRREQWGSLLGPLLSTWYRCAVHLEDVELSVRLLIEMLSRGVNAPQDSESLEDELMDILNTKTAPEQPIVMEVLESQPLFDTSLVFWKPEVRVGELAGFQLSLAAPTNTSIRSLPFSALEIYMKEDNSPIVIRHADSDAEEGLMLQRVDLGHVDEARGERSVEASLRWRPGGTIIFTGTMSSNIPTQLTLSHLKLHLTHEEWRVEIPLKPCKSRDESNALAPRWLSSLDPVRYVAINREEYTSVNVRHRPHNVAISVTHQAPAYLNESFPVNVEVTNTDDKELEVMIDVLLLPTELDNAINTIAIDEEQSSGLIKGVTLGSLAPGTSATKTLHLVSTGAAGDRTLDVSVQSRAASAVHEGADGESQPELLDITETLQTVVVPTIDPFKMTCDVIYRRAVGPRIGLADLRSFDSDFWDDGDGGVAEVRSTFRCDGPSNLEVESLVLKKQDGTQAKILTSSMDDIGDDVFPSEYLEGDEFGDVCCVSIAPHEEDTHFSQLLPIAVPGEYEIAWRRKLSDHEYGARTISNFILPPLQPPVDGLIGLLDIPSFARLHQPTTMSLMIRNRHPTRSANITVHLDPEPTDGFIVSGLRNGRVPVLLPGGEERLVWRLIPVECGYVKPPKIRILDRRKAIASSQGLGGPGADVQTEGVPVKLVDLRTEQKVVSLNIVGASPTDGAVEDGAKQADDNPIAHVLVLP
ncbi:hypothetical protein V5O48_003082 [Marasmius crinis-equi]|uniref:Trafficking protein particle complex subunit 11 n=1 Tax=Marasmius crinis-equi TaxID=585013 RepID=A0ABR3FTX4_9AGAR